MTRLRYSLFTFTLIMLAVSASAAAQAPPPDKLNIQTFDAAVGKNVYITQHGAQVPDHLAFGVGVLFNYQRNPFSIYNVDASGNRGDVQTAVVKDFLAAELYGYLGLFKHISIGLSMPLSLYMTGTETDELGMPVGDGLSAFAWGDVALHIKGHIYTLKKAGLSFGAQLSITAPTGRYSEHFVGDELPTFRPRVIAELRQGPLSAAVNLGGVFRIKESTFYDDNFRIGQQFTYGLAVALRPARKLPLKIFLEYFGRTDFSGLVDGSPMELGVGVGYGLPKGVHLLLGGSAGLLAGIGAPDFRLFLGVRWAPSFKDTDDDGVTDGNDKCPDQKEDRDGFQDHDGCPDPDNDKDGIDDGNDKCPNEKEDFDKYQDDDGCPEYDNDGDGVPDKRDNCPMHKGAAKDKGCPPSMLDDDGDGLPNVRDKCPQKAEDKDDFEDGDGCPDLDNDKDGIPDEHDQCKNQAEDKDGHQDSDGCPDPDNDGDGVCDNNPTIQNSLTQYRGRCIGADKCPKSAETVNGKRDSDGCPDRGRGAFSLSAVAGSGYQGRFLTRGINTWFRGTSTTLTRKGGRALKQLAHMLRMKAYQPLRKVVIMGFVEPRLSGGKSVSQAWADTARTRLIGLGVKADRLGAIGAGGSSPKCKSRSRRCRRRNRRIEFFITIIKK
jgi:OmpA-OmpF porin, OOP family